MKSVIIYIVNFLQWTFLVWAKIPHDKYQHIVSSYFGFEILKLFTTDITATIIIVVAAALKELVVDGFLKMGNCSFWDWVASVSTVAFYLTLKYLV